jgi:hypothetical protein
MGELRSLIGTRDEMMKEIASAPPGALIVVVIDAETIPVRLRWEGIKKGGEGRALSWMATVLQRVALGFLNQVPAAQAGAPPEPPPEAPKT